MFKQIQSVDVPKGQSQAFYYSPKNLSEIYGIPLVTVRQWIRRGDFKDVMKVGKHLRVPHLANIEFDRKHIQEK